MNAEDLKNILLVSQLLNFEEIEKASEESVKLKRPLERVIVDMHLLEKESLYKTIAQHIGVEYKSLIDVEIAGEVVSIYPEELARSTKSLPLFKKDEMLHITMEDPTNVTFIDQIQLLTNYPIEIYLSPPDDIEFVLNRIYKRGDSQNLFTELQDMKEGGEGGTSIVKIVDIILSQAHRDGASDIHLEPEENLTRLRFRIDGILHEVPSPPKEWESAMISRVKVLASMDIAESRVPQDGHFQAKVDDKVIDFRVSTLPTIYGENLVLRLLDTASVTIGLERLGFTTYDDLKKYEELIARPYGIILSTGPTGSGKTTTLYSALTRINTTDRNIITLEDPVEYRLGLIRQVQINPRAGITFANGLRAILRQDPDVIMVGEIRDLETSRMAIQSALTGHLVFSTLHTNDASSSITRLMDMGVESFLVAASLIGIMAQRLVRCICPNCKEQYQPSKAVLKKWGLENRNDVLVYRGKGCQNCKGTGYKSRTGIYELMAIDDELRELIIQNTSTVAIRKKAQEKGMRLLWEDGREKVLKGITTFEEVGRVCEEQVDLKPAQAEVKPVQIEVKPYITVKEEQTVMKFTQPEAVKVASKDMEEYSSRITRWLSGK